MLSRYYKAVRGSMDTRVCRISVCGGSYLKLICRRGDEEKIANYYFIGTSETMSIFWKFQALIGLGTNGIDASVLVYAASII